MVTTRFKIDYLLSPVILAALRKSVKATTVFSHIFTGNKKAIKMLAQVQDMTVFKPL